jgi:hypothetical protein
MLEGRIMYIRTYPRETHNEDGWQRLNIQDVPSSSGAYVGPHREYTDIDEPLLPLDPFRCSLQREDS